MDFLCFESYKIKKPGLSPVLSPGDTTGDQPPFGFKFTTTLWVQPVSQFSTQQCVDPFKPWASSFSRRMLACMHNDLDVTSSVNPAVTVAVAWRCCLHGLSASFTSPQGACTPGQLMARIWGWLCLCLGPELLCSAGCELVCKTTFIIFRAYLLSMLSSARRGRLCL